MTSRQFGTIEKIEANTKHRFKWTRANRGTACDFIGAHIDESVENARILWRQVNEEEGIIREQLLNDMYDDVMEQEYKWGK